MAAKSLKALLIVAAASMAAIGLAVPDVLIFRIKTGTSAIGDYPICDALANEIQAGGRLNPIVWDETDPTFRTAVNKGQIPLGVTVPTLEQAQAAAGKMHAEYLLAVDVSPDSNGILAAAFLYKGSKLWQDPVYDLGPTERMYKPLLKKKKMTQEEYDTAIMRASHKAVSVKFGDEYGVQATLRSLAHSWVEQMNSGPLRNLEPGTVTTTPDPLKGQKPVVPITTPTPEPPKSDDRWQKDYQAAIDANDHPKAVIILRDAVDSDPFDFKRRVAFVKALMSMGRPAVAAQEARRGAELMPDKSELRIMAARAWMAAGNEDEAQADLNEAIARSPESIDTRLLLAEVALAKNKPADAIPHLDAILAKGANAQAFYDRAMANAFLGDSVKFQDDLAKASEAKLPMSDLDFADRYFLLQPLFDHSIELLSGDIRTLHQKALVQRTEPDVLTQTADLSKQVDCRARFLSSVSPPKSHRKSHERRVLAYKLLSQCLTDLQSYLKSGEEDVLTESRINLGESLKQMASAKIAFQEESEAPKGNEKSTGS